MRSPLQNVNVATIGNYFTEEFRQPRSALIFFKGLVLYTFVKILFIWNVSATFLQYHRISKPGSLLGKILLLPSFLAEMNVHVFYFATLVFVIVAFFVKPYYVIRFLFFYLTFNLYVINLPIANGSDIVLFMLSFWCILMGGSPSRSQNVKTDVQKVTFNLGLVLCQLQIINIYLISGLDKLFSKLWRSGDAFAFITHLDFYFNPILPGIFSSDPWNFVFSWATILFELLFVVLAWNKRTRLPIIVAGIFFNLFIWIVLSIPDFALLMMISFLIFLKDEDYQRLMNRFRRSPL